MTTPDPASALRVAPPRDERLRPTERIQLPYEFQQILKRGRCFRDPALRVHFRENGRELSRIGLVVSKKVGGSVVRSRVKRGLRELFRKAKHCWPVPLDVVFIPEARSSDSRSPAGLARAMERFVVWVRTQPAGRTAGGK